MAIKIEYNKIIPIKSVYDDYTFMTNGASINQGTVAGVINTFMFTSLGGGLGANGLPTFSHKLKVRFYNNNEPELIQQIVGNLSANFSYHKTKLNHDDTTLPDETEESKRNLFGNKSHSYYSFQLPDYEEITLEANESSLPCYLFGVYNKRINSSYSNSLLEKQSPELNGVREFNFLSKYPIHASNKKTVFDFHSTYDYSKSYYDIFMRLNATNVNPDFNERSKVLFISEKAMAQSKESELYDLPFYNDVKVPKTPSYGDSIRDPIFHSSLADIVMRRMHLKSVKGTMDSFASMPSVQFLDLMDSDIPSQEMTFGNDIGLSLYDPVHSEIQSESAFDDFEYFHSVEELMVRMFNFANSNQLNISQMVNGVNCYNEALFYKVVKTREGRTTPVQTFYMFNPLSGEKLSILDTQIRFNTGYTYTFYAYYCILGFDVEVANTSFVESSIPEFEAEYRVIPNMKVVEAETGNFTTRVVEPPPRKPIVKFSNYKNKDNKIKLTIEDRTGTVVENRYRQELVALSTADEEYKQYLSEYCNSLYPYHSNVASYGSFEIYRTETMPKALQDFEGNLVQIVSNDIVDKYSRKRIKKVSTTHYLEHGKKYYYLFRARTHQDNFSNPSPVYEVEKIKDSDETILRVKSIKVETKELVSYDTSFRKFLKISYPEYHTFGRSMTPNGEVDTAIGSGVSLKLGEENLPDGLWMYNSLSGSHIKLRLESKSTGKKIDFNLIFNYNQPENN